MMTFLQFFRYVLVGIISNLIGFLIYWFLTDFGFSPRPTMTALYGFATLIGFLGNRNWTFGDHGGLSASAARYFLTYAVGYLLNLMLLTIGVEFLALPHLWVQAVAVPIVAIFLFLGLKFFVFNNLCFKRADA